MTEVLLTAAEWASMMRAPLRDNSYQLTGLGGSVRDYLAWKAMSGAAERTLDSYERDLARACTTHPEKGLTEWTSEDCLHALQLFPTKSQRRARAAMADFFKWAYLWRHIVENPMLRLPVIREPELEPHRIFTDEEEDALCSLRETRDRALMLILFGTGIRQEEGRRLRFADIDLDQGRLTVRRSKSRKGRVIPIGERVAQAVAELAILEGLNPTDFLWFTRPQGRAIRRDKEMKAGAMFYRWWARCLAEAEVEYVPRNPKLGTPGRGNPHLTRHTFATKYLRAGGRLEILARILGHSSVAITMKYYAHLIADDLAQDLERVLAVRGGRSHEPHT